MGSVVFRGCVAQIESGGPNLENGKCLISASLRNYENVRLTQARDFGSLKEAEMSELTLAEFICIEKVELMQAKDFRSLKEADVSKLMWQNSYVTSCVS